MILKMRRVEYTNSGTIIHNTYSLPYLNEHNIGYFNGGDWQVRETNDWGCGCSAATTAVCTHYQASQWYEATNTVTYQTGINIDTAGNHINTNDWIINTGDWVEHATGGWKRSPEDSKLAMKHKIQRQLKIQRHCRSQRFANFDNAKENELVALQLLRNMVGSDQFRRYLKNGFIMVEGPSGLMYQVVRKHHNIVVWDKQGRKLNTLCVYLKDSTIPPTDEVVAKKLIIELDEKDIWKRANVGYTGAGRDVARELGLHKGKAGVVDQIIMALDGGTYTQQQVIAA